MIISRGFQRIRIDEDTSGWFSGCDSNNNWYIEFEYKDGSHTKIDCKDKKDAEEVLKKLDKLLKVVVL